MYIIEKTGIYTLLSNCPFGTLIGNIDPVVSPVGKSFNMALEGVLEFTYLEKINIYYNLFISKDGQFYCCCLNKFLFNHHILSSQDMPESEISMVEIVLTENKTFRIE